mgnify:CR=1 FL=1
MATKDKIIPKLTTLCPLLIPIPSEVTNANEIRVSYLNNNEIQIKYKEANPFY